MSLHPSPPDPQPPPGRPKRTYEHTGKPPRGAFDRLKYQRELMRKRRAKAKQQ